MNGKLSNNTFLKALCLITLSFPFQPCVSMEVLTSKRSFEESCPGTFLSINDTTRTKLKTLDTDTIRHQNNKTISSDTIKTQVLPDLHVEADSHLFKPGKSVYTPSKRDKNIATDATSLLMHMNIPQLRVINSSVTTISGSSVEYFINGMPATADDLTGMMIKNVRKVEYLEYPTDAKFGGAPYVINYIVQEYEYGGYSKASLYGQFIGMGSFQESIFSKFAYKKMTYDLSFSPSQSSTKHKMTESVETFRLSDDDIVTRKVIPSGSKSSSSKYPVNFRALYRSGATTISNIVGFSISGNGRNTSHGIIVSDKGGQGETSMEYQQSAPPVKTRFINWSGSVYIQPGRGWNMRIDPYFAHSYYKINDRYETSEETDIVNNIHEKTYIGSLNLNIQKSIGRHTVSTMINGGLHSSRSEYTGSSVSSNDFNSKMFSIRGTYSYNFDKAYLYSHAGFMRESEGINGNSIITDFPFAAVSANYVPDNKNTFSFWAQYTSYSAAKSERNPSVIQSNEVMYLSGNPELKSYPGFDTSLSYTWIPQRKFNLTAYISYTHRHNVIHRVYEVMPDSRGILTTYKNSGNINTIVMSLAINLKLFNDRLHLYAYPYLKINKLTDSYMPNLNPFFCYLSATYYAGNCYFMAFFQKTAKDYSGIAYDKITDSPHNYGVEAGWGNGKVNLSLRLYSPFRTSWKERNYWIYSPVYTYKGTNYGTSRRQLIDFSLTYTIDYGKKIQHGNEISGDVGGAGSSILR